MEHKNLKKGSTEIMKEIADALGYKTKYLSTESVPKRLMVSNGKKMCVINSSKYGWYPEMQRWHQHLFDSKILTQEVLTSLGYNTIPTFKVQCKKYASFAKLKLAISDKLKKYPVIVKPEIGFQGKGINIALNQSMLFKTLKEHYAKSNDVLVQPILVDDEYRILIINNVVHVIHIKKWHHVVGDGIQSIGKLLEKIKIREKDETFIKQQLVLRKLTLDTILEVDKTFPYHLTRFSSPGNYYESKKIPQNISRWAEKLAKDISAPTMGIDIFAPSGLKNPKSFIVIELNSNPAFDYIEKRYKDSEKMRSMMEGVLTHYFK